MTILIFPLLISGIFLAEADPMAFTRIEECQVTSRKEIRGIVLVGREDALLDKEALEDIEGIQTKELDLPGSTDALNRELSPYLCDVFCERIIKQIERRVYQYYRDFDRPFIIVSVPRQQPETGVVQLVVQESILGKLEVVGNKWTSAKRYENYFKIQPGDPIYPRQFSKAIDFMNRNPYRWVNVVYRPGQRKYTTDITLQVQDQKPYRFYTGFDNTGVLPTGRQRVFAGFSWDQLFGLDHIFFYQYTTNYNANRFHANTFQYMAMFPWEQMLNLYGGYAILHATLPSPNRNNHGTNIQASLRYTIPLLPAPRFFSHEINIGFDLKHTNNTMEFVDFTPTFGKTVNLTEWMLGYFCRYQDGRQNLESGIECFVSPVEWLHGQTDADFESLRPGAQNKWIYGRVYFDMNPLPFYSFSCRFFLQGQVSSQTLLPSEQLGMGGYSTVRGYDERQYNADTGLLGSIEIHSPRFSLFVHKGKNTDQAYFLLFLDGGGGYDLSTVPQVPAANFLLGAGPGFRYSLNSSLTARVDWGIKLHQQADFTGGDSMIHFSVTGSY